MEESLLLPANPATQAPPLPEESLAASEVRRTDHAAVETLSTGPSRFTESRISTDPSATATSTQPPLFDAVLLRHVMHAPLKSATCLPRRRVAGLRPVLGAMGSYQGIQPACGSVDEAAPI